MSNDAIWLLGCGNMAGAMLLRWLETGLDARRVTVIRPSGKPVAPGVRVVTAVPADDPPPAVLLLGVKPQKLGEVAGMAAGPETTLISILAGATVANLRAAFPAAGTIVRSMPNTPVALGKGAVALYAPSRTPEAEAVAAMMAPLGLVEWVEDEPMLDAVTALSGAGPAFLFRFIDALGAAGADIGLPPEQAARLALATIDGAAALAVAAGESPAMLAERVASPGGATRAGLNILDGEAGLAPLISRTLAAARQRSAELARGG
ncbi:pyrroline-5-carboxylate reductase family protein [Sphingomonas sanxanigenens]|uniref:Pyrroline-5-carboxylate reductase n=1 Tax=Sphingomonas sanxanigenens DSM 19645 = NX02 TaxID=1123269 RepID=W0A8Z4_9SPHN|nr:pyrroline-5-carboxylate reductase [Sphingomonas sanxanigenens]AHE53536.1 hypothetical protein NX02_09075 [Sphingomonas sanxanigenens DSM 19645 = NX02]